MVRKKTLIFLFQNLNFFLFEVILSSEWTDYTHEGGFYDFGGGWRPQRVTGVNWLTDYADEEVEDIARPRVHVGRDGYFITYELWRSNSYVETFFQKIDSSGRKIGEAVSLGDTFRIVSILFRICD